MKMAKASDDDISLSIEIASIVDDLEKGHRPWRVFGEDDDKLWLDMDSVEDLRAVVEKIREIASRGSLFRVVFGMGVLLDPKNEVVDPDAYYLDIHPKFIALIEALQRIGAGQEMEGRFTHAETVLRYQEIARAVIAKATGEQP